MQGVNCTRSGHETTNTKKLTRRRLKLYWSGISSIQKLRPGQMKMLQQQERRRRRRQLNWRRRRRNIGTCWSAVDGASSKNNNSNYILLLPVGTRDGNFSWIHTRVQLQQYFFPLREMKIHTHIHTCTGTYFSFDCGKRNFDAHEASMSNSGRANTVTITSSTQANAKLNNKLNN